VGPIDALWHLLNLFAPAVGVGLLASLLAKLLWRHELQGVALRQLCAWSTSGAALAWFAALVVFGRDGRMISYGAMVLVCAISLWWVGFGARGR
jgi:hypothetical protein